MLDRELNPTHVITRDASGGYVLTPVEDMETLSNGQGESQE